MPDSRPPGTTSPTLLTISSTDRRGLLVIATIVSVVFSCVAVLIRVCVRTNPRPHFLWEDVAQIVSLAQSGTVLFAIAHGFGKTAEDASYEGIIVWGKAIYFGDILFVIAMWMTKCSTAYIFVRRPFKGGHNRLVFAAVITFTVFMFISVLLLALRCSLPPPGTPFQDFCTAGESTRWVLVASLDVISELFLFSLSIHLVAGLHLRLAAKLAVVAVFGARLLLVAPAVLHTHLLQSALESGDPSLHGIGAAVCSQAEMCTAIVSTAAVALNPFVTALSAQHGGASTTAVAGLERADRTRVWAGRTLSTCNERKRELSTSFALESFASRADREITSQSGGSVSCGSRRDAASGSIELTDTGSLSHRSGHDMRSGGEKSVVYEFRNPFALHGTSHHATVSWGAPMDLPLEESCASAGGIMLNVEWSVAIEESHEAVDKP
ncbi:hypothetical protein RB599_010426 [Gaeumannomyces hyphopodioides]